VARWKARERATGPVAELVALEAECAAAAAGGDERAVALLRQVRSWLDMLAAAGSDAEIARLFVIFASEGRARMSEWWSNPAPGPDGG
jgi:hypothetical protein